MTPTRRETGTVPRIQVLGYGSLLDEDSARRTAPALADYRLVEVPDQIRIFNKVSLRCLNDPTALRTAEIAACAARPAPGSHITACAFSCTPGDFMALFEREHQYRWVEAPFTERNGVSGLGRMCVEWTDSEYLLNRCITHQEYKRRLGPFYDGPFWRSDILPYPPYLRLCLEAARSHGPDVYTNFCTSSFLADGTTTIGHYIQDNPGLSAQ